MAVSSIFVEILLQKFELIQNSFIVQSLYEHERIRVQKAPLRPRTKGYALTTKYFSEKGEVGANSEVPTAATL